MGKFSKPNNQKLETTGWIIVDKKTNKIYYLQKSDYLCAFFKTEKAAQTFINICLSNKVKPIKVQIKKVLKPQCLYI